MPLSALAANTLVTTPGELLLSGEARGTTVEQEDGHSYSRRFILALITIATFLNPFTGTAINLALPSIGAEFAADAATLAWVSSAYLLASVIFLLPGGRLGDSRGRVTVFMAGIVVYTAGALLTIFTPTIGMLLAFRFLQGVGGAMIYANSVALITHLYPPGERGYAIGLNTTAVYAGLSLGPFLGGALTQFLGWRSIFIVTALLAVPVLIYAKKFPVFLNDRHQEHFDVPGLVLSSALILCLFLGLASATTPRGVVLLFAALVLGVAFYLVERRHPSPLLPVSLLSSNRVFAASNAAALINYSATYAVGFLLSLYLQYIRGYEPVAAGTLLLVQPVIQVFVAPVAGRLADRIQPGHVASVGMAISAVGLFGLSMLGDTTPVGAILALLVLLGVGVGLFSSPNTTAIMGCVEKRFYGSASAMTAMMRSLGMMLSMGAVLVVFAFIMGSTAVTPAIFPEFLRSVHLIFLAFGVLSVFGVILSLRRNK
ncbi:MFS transporter [Methanoculleus sp. 10]|uniref:MFS transporter n=1 Tax=Methanoculleus sp. 10 TaxID=430615 RepID=UPI0025F126CC|nr:MFS transporter [Methanoculleus sp. 10]